MEPWVIWVGLGLLAMAAELLAPGVFLVWVGAAAVLTGLVLLAFAPSLTVTVLVFILLLGLGIGLSLRVFRAGGRAGTLNTPASGLVGRAGVLLAAEGTAGRARIGDSDWPVRLAAEAAPGARVVVVAVEGMTLLVRAEG
ncbi:MAG: rane protein [Roseomonas sp.]|jgi:membrane protein implicated in regulation of membrane protease activity|nr:rane protein [Roseomonas sp.]